MVDHTKKHSIPGDCRPVFVGLMEVPGIPVFCQLGHILTSQEVSNNRRRTTQSILVGGLEHFFFDRLGMSSSQLTNSYISEGLKPPTKRVSLPAKMWVYQVLSCKHGGFRPQRGL